jgi:transposase
VRDGGDLDVLEAPVYLLEDVTECWVVNARDVKNVPGRAKTDRLDAVWLCKLAERGMLRPSFVPPVWQRELRDLCRYRRTLIQERTREKQRAGGETAGRHPDQAVGGDQRHLRQVWPGHAGGADRRAA